MDTTFDIWNEEKKIIENNLIDPTAFPQVGEVWIGVLGKNIGREQNGIGENFLRPLLVVKKFNNEIFWIVPLSTKQKQIDYYYNFTDQTDQKVSAVLAQMRLVHIKRFKRKLYDFNAEDMENVKRQLRQYLGEKLEEKQGEREEELVKIETPPSLVGNLGAPEGHCVS